MTQVPAPERPERRVDGSMSLLVDMMTNSLDSSYAEAAARKAGAADPSRPGGTPATGPVRRAVALGTLVAVGVVTGTAAAQVRSRDQAMTGVRGQLVEDVQRRTAATDDLAQTAARLRTEVAQLSEAGLSAGAAGQAAARQLAALELAAGVAPVSGPGIIVRLDDPPAQPADAAPPEDGAEQPEGPQRVLDRDLQDVVNALWAAGAEAISINDLRLTTQTAIRSAGEAILVDYRPLSPPYTVRAIGNAKVLEPEFVDGEVGRRLATFTEIYGISLRVTRTDKQTLPGSGSPTLRQARPEVTR